MVSEKEDSEIISWRDLQQHALAWINGIYKSFRFFRDVIIRHWRLSWALIAIFALISVGWLYVRAQEFSMSTTFVYGELHPKIFGDMVEKLNALLQYDPAGKGTELLLLTNAQLKKINRINITDSQGKPLVNNYTMRKEPFIVTVNLSELIDEDSLRQGLTYYFNSNPFTADRLDLKKKNWQEELKYINFKLKTIDSVLVQLYAGKPSGEQEKSGVTIENSEGKNAYELLSMSREMMQRKSDLEGNLSYPENVIPIDNFLILPKAQFNTGAIVKYGLAGGMLGYFLACFFLFLNIYIKPLVK
ncbi:MAG: hypothetical protein DHS20C18_15800 [Saprospiraceae bacterium]|nr:MAG: hypothetical protein DHS20C18_15800 [Saprospiraceae bacterium]